MNNPASLTHSQRVKRLTGLMVVFALFVGGCSFASPSKAPTPTFLHTPEGQKTHPVDPTITPGASQHLRIVNQSTLTLHDLTVIFPDERIVFGDVAGGATSAYREARQGVYRYAAYEVTVNGQHYEQPVMDWVGEVPMQGESFTYRVEVDPSRWQTEDQVIQLIEASPDQGEYPAPSAPAQTSYCAQLVKTYVPPAGFKLYCDDAFEFAFEYPPGWEVEGLGIPTPDPTAQPQAILQRLIFYSPNYDNMVRFYTFRMPPGATLEERLTKELFISNAYRERVFKKDYTPMRIGGKPAYGFVNRYAQDYNGCTLIFEHGNTFYTLVELKIISRARLDMNWQIAHSIQVRGAKPEDTIISEELVEDSYRLLP